MYDEQTYNTVLERMLDRVPDTLDKRQGSIIYDALAPAAIEIAQLYWELDNVLDESFVDTASREYLERRCAERNITPEPATYAVVKGTFSPDSVDIAAGTRFNLGQFNYAVTEKISAGIYKLQCETAGSAPNESTGELIPIEYLDGLESAAITEVLIPGEDEESDDSLRKRYAESFNDQSSGGNITWYKRTLKTIDGVGGVKVIPAWNGAGTVKTIFQNSDYGVPSTDLITAVQTVIDPTQNHGEGVGMAPIGHTVTVEGVTADTINISTNVTLESGVAWADITTAVNGAIDSYLKRLNAAWEDNANLIVRISQIEIQLMSVPGIIDVDSTKINNAASNYTVASSKVAVIGTVTKNG